MSRDAFITSDGRLIPVEVVKRTRSKPSSGGRHAPGEYAIRLELDDGSIEWTEGSRLWHEEHEEALKKGQEIARLVAGTMAMEGDCIDESTKDEIAAYAAKRMLEAARLTDSCHIAKEMPDERS